MADIKERGGKMAKCEIHQKCAPTKLWQGVREEFGDYDETLSENTTFGPWATPSRKYADMYGLSETRRVEFSLGQILDMSAESVIKGDLAWRTVSEWVEVFRAKSISGAELIDEDFGDVEVPLWMLFDPTDLDATRATNLSTTIRKSNYDSIRTMEKGWDGKLYEAIALVMGR